MGPGAQDDQCPDRYPRAGGGARPLALSGVLTPTFLTVPAMEPTWTLACVGVVLGLTGASVEARVGVTG